MALTPGDVQQAAEATKRVFEVAAPFIGRVFHPNYTRAMAHARANELEIMGPAIREAVDRYGLVIAYSGGQLDLKAGPAQSLELSASLQERAEARAHERIVREQQNVERVTTGALLEVLDSAQLPDELPDEDWVARLYAHIENVSSERMQTLWSKVLAGEIKKPGSFSLRALDTLRNMSAREAQAFVLLSGFVWTQTREEAYASSNFVSSSPLERSVIEGEVVKLAEAGLIDPSRKILAFFDSSYIDILNFHEHTLLVKVQKRNTALNMVVWSLTSVGAELRHLIEPKFNIEYVERIGQWFADCDCEASLVKNAYEPNKGRLL